MPEDIEVYEEFDKCVKGQGPHGHIVATVREDLGRRNGKQMFSWECTQCGQVSKVSVVVFVDRRGQVL